MKNQAAFLLEQQKIEISECEFPKIGADDVLIEMEYVGICGSDIHFYQHGRIGRRVVNDPFILGHECSGIICGKGENVANFSVGDRVTLEPGIGCGHCKFCRSGRYNICPDVKFISTPPDNGALRRFMTYPAKACFKLPEHVTAVEGAMIEPFSVGIHAAKRGDVNAEKVVMIQGCGCIGIMTLLACKAMQAKTVIVNDISDVRLRKAKELGADYIINGMQENVEKRVSEITDGYGADVVFEAAGNPKTALQAVGLVKRGGTIVQVGNVTEETPYVFNELSRLEVDIKTVFRYCNDFQTALELIENGVVDLKQVNPKIYPFSDAALAFSRAMNNADQATKYMIGFKETIL